MYINDLPDHVDCNVSLFADNTLIYQTVNTVKDYSVFQSNITYLSKWADSWHMSFNVDKCSIMCFNQKPTAPVAAYAINGVKLDTVYEINFFGVVIQNDL